MNSHGLFNNFCRRLLVVCVVLGLTTVRTSAWAALMVGGSKVDITPETPIRLTGYAVRQHPATTVAQRLWAKALAVSDDVRGASVVVTVDNCGVPANVTEDVAARLLKKVGLPRERFAVCSTHTHTGPLVRGFAPNIFAREIPRDQELVIDEYTRNLTHKLEQVALEALANIRPATLHWGRGTAEIARNRRTSGGPVDPSVNVLEARGTDGKTFAILANYACHCTTLGGEFNSHCGDWAGYAQEELEVRFPAALALFSIGCGADSNPFPRGGADGGLAHAKKHGETLAIEVQRVIREATKPLLNAPEGRFRRIELPYQRHFSVEELESRSKVAGIVGYHANRLLNKIRSGTPIPETLEYPVQAWVFGRDLAMVFLGGEVVVDYAIGLKDLFDGQRLWVNAYANDVPCYIPSRRILQEGGYEAEESLWYYDRPARLHPGIEAQIIHTVQSIIPGSYINSNPTNAAPPPQSIQESMQSFRHSSDLLVECVASEPLIVDPVAIDFGMGGELWVLEMRDYPSGMDLQGNPGGRIRLLRDLDSDGHYDVAETFLYGLPYPTGIMAWRDGVIIGAAPDVLFARDTNGDGRADSVETWFTGFATHNFQARVNGFALGMDGWLHGSSGLFGGMITNRLSALPDVVDCKGRDFKWDPLSGVLSADSGISQQGRIRDDFGRWFGNDNSTLLWFYPFPEAALRRNPFFATGRDRLSLAAGEQLIRVHPASRTLARFNDPEHANRVTSACGPGLYRDSLLGAHFQGNAFVCEPVHNLVRRLVLEPQGSVFRAVRASTETTNEFLASTDNWFRPVQVRTGPDGAIWVVDMYRFVIEHTRWITPDRLARIDVRDGSDRGRIYRIRPANSSLRPIPDLTRLSPPALAGAFDTPNGTVRDLVQQRLMQLGLDAKTEGVLRTLCRQSGHAEVRAHSLSLLDSSGRMDLRFLRSLLSDSDPRVLEVLVRVCGSKLAKSETSPGPILDLLQPLLSHPSPRIRFELALAFGACREERAGDMLSDLLISAADDDWLQEAVVRAQPRHADRLLQTAVGRLEPGRGRRETFAQLASTAGASLAAGEVGEILERIMERNDPKVLPVKMVVAAALLESMSRKQGHTSEELRSKMAGFLASCREIATNSGQPSALVVDALKVLRHDPFTLANPGILRAQLDPSTQASVQEAVFGTLSASSSTEMADFLFRAWPGLMPGQRQRAVEMLLGRTNWTERLVASLESGSVAVLDLTAAQRDRLLRLEQAELRKRIMALFKPDSSGSRAGLISGILQNPARDSDSARGEMVFTRNCATCHRFKGQGTAVGPDIEQVTDRSPSYLLQAILDPNRAIDDRYRAYEVALKSGRTLSGIITAETAASITLIQAGGLVEGVLRSDIQRLAASGLSLMPEGFEAVLQRQELWDLLAFLRAGVGAEERNREQFLKSGQSRFEILRAAERVPQDSFLGRQELALVRLGSVTSKLEWIAEPVEAAGPSGFQRFRFAIGMGFLSQPPGKFRLFVDHKPGVVFDVTTSSASWNSEDGLVRAGYTVLQSSAQDGSGVLVVDLARPAGDAGRRVHFEVQAEPIQSQRWFGLYRIP